MITLTSTLILLLAWIALVTINSMAIIGFHLATQEGNILHFVERLLCCVSDKIQKPLYACPTCMASVHSVYFYFTAWFILSRYEYIPLAIAICVWPIYIISLSGTATFIFRNMSDD